MKVRHNSKLFNQLTNKKLPPDATYTYSKTTDIEAPFRVTVTSKKGNKTLLDKAISDPKDIHALLKHSKPVHGYWMELIGTSLVSVLLTPLLASAISNGSTFAKIIAMFGDGTPLSSEMQSIYDADDNIGRKFIKFSIPAIIGSLGTQIVLTKTLESKYADMVVQDLNNVRNSKDSKFTKSYSFHKKITSIQVRAFLLSILASRFVQYILGAGWAQLFDKTDTSSPASGS